MFLFLTLSLSISCILEDALYYTCLNLFVCVTVSYSLCFSHLLPLSLLFPLPLRLFLCFCHFFLPSRLTFYLNLALPHFLSLSLSVSSNYSLSHNPCLSLTLSRFLSLCLYHQPCLLFSHSIFVSQLPI